jgi:predicted dehydrogenase
MARRKLNVALIGYDFMGRAHSNAWRQVAHFFKDLPFEPVLKVVVGRTEASGSSPRPTFEDGLQNQRVLDAIERSAGTGRWEKIAERTNG